MVTAVDGCGKFEQCDPNPAVQEVTSDPVVDPAGEPVDFFDNGGAEDDARRAAACKLQVNHSLWKDGSTPAGEGLLPNLWQMVETHLKDAISQKCYDPGQTISVSIPSVGTNSNGLRLHGIKICFPRNVNVGAELNFVVKSDGKLDLKDIEYNFSEPIMAACNFEIHLSFADIIECLRGPLSKKTVLKLAANSTVVSYDRDDAGRTTVPAALAFDTVKFFVQKSGQPSINLELRNNEYLNDKGWANYTFGTKEGSCKGDKNDPAKGEFLGDLSGDGECRNTMLGRVISHAIMKWIIGEWQSEYNKFKQGSGGDPMMGIAGTSNIILNSGVGGCDLGFLEREQTKLGKDYLRWKKSHK